MTALFFLGAFLVSAWSVWNAWNLYKLASGLYGRSWEQPLWWVRLLSVSVFCAAGVWLWGILSGGLDVQEECARRGADYDDSYRHTHHREPGQWFPLHNRCNADHDLVPSWVNPSLVVLAVLAVASALMVTVLALKHVTRSAGWRRRGPGRCRRRRRRRTTRSGGIRSR